MGKTLVEKIISKKTGRSVSAGETVVVDLDFVALHDGSGPLALRLMDKMKWEGVFDPKKVMFCTEFGPTPKKELANEHKLLREFADKHGCYWHEGGTGNIHTHLLENYVKCGDIIVAGDSHTTTHGALGAFSTGMGSTDMLGVLHLGRTWIKVPETFRVQVEGKLQEGTYSKDIFLKLLGDIGSEGAIYKALEFGGETITNMSMDARFTISNMGVEAGAKAAVMGTDDETLSFLKQMKRGQDFAPIAPDPDAVYEKTIRIDASEIPPMVALPHYVENVSPVSEVKDLKIHEVFIGSCTNGRTEDMHVAASTLKGGKFSSRVRVIVIPNSQKVFQECIHDGTFATLADAGAMIMAPNCGPCMGVHEGIPADGENVVSTQNRNFKGRMGNATANIYLVSPATAAASAMTGRLTDPREVA